MTEWYSVTTPEETDRLLGAWEDAPTENLELCGFILDTARLQVLAYAPELDPLEPILTPFNYVYAQLQQAKNLWNAGRVTTGGEVGVDQFSYTPRPLDKTIRNIIRPADGRPHVL